jgi:hypothetical protein
MHRRFRTNDNVPADLASEAGASAQPLSATPPRSLPRAEWRDGRCTWHFDGSDDAIAPSGAAAQTPATDPTAA